MKVMSVRLLLVLVGAIACAKQINGQIIELGPGRNLHFAGYTTSPLSFSDQGSQDIMATSATALSQAYLQHLNLAPSESIVFLEPADKAFLWFSGFADRKELSLAVSNENGWYDFAQPSAFANGVIAYSLNCIPVNSTNLKVIAYAGEAKSSSKPITEFKAAYPGYARSSLDNTATQLPVTMTSGKYRFVVRRITSGFSRLLNFDEPNVYKENDFLTGPLPKALLPEQPYSGIVWEFDEAVTTENSRAALQTAGYVSVHSQWNEYARVSDSNGNVWIQDFDGQRSGSGSIGYMETPVNLPDSGSPLTYDFYLVRENDPRSTFVTIAEFAWPGENQIVDPVTTTIKSVRLKADISQPRRKLPEQLTKGRYGNPVISMTSPDPIPGAEVKVTATGLPEIIDRYSFSSGDDIHKTEIEHLSSSPKSKYYVKPGTTITLSIKLPETVYFQFTATPERPG